MGWFEDNADALEEKGISREWVEDFANRNTNADGSKDYHRAIEAYDNVPGQDQVQTRQASSNSGSSGGGGNGGGGSPLPYQPFTEQFVAPTPIDLPVWTGGDFKGPTRPGDLMEAWSGGPFTFDPTKIKDNPAYQVRMGDMIKAVDRSASSRGLTFTPAAREELLRRSGDLASTELDAEFGRQLGGYTTNVNTFEGDKARRAAEATQIFDEALGTYGTNRGNFESDRGFTANRNDTAFGQARSTYLDKAAIHDTNESGRFGSERSNLLDTRAYEGQQFNQNRLTQNDQWARGTDIWGMNRTDKNDLFDQNYRLSDLILRNRPRPAA